MSSEATAVVFELLDINLGGVRKPDLGLASLRKMLDTDWSLLDGEVDDGRNPPSFPTGMGSNSSDIPTFRSLELVSLLRDTAWLLRYSQEDLLGTWRLEPAPSCRFPRGRISTTDNILKAH